MKVHRVRVTSLLLRAAAPLAFVAAVFALPASARAQSAGTPSATISDADRKAARDLFFQGVDLQNAGKFAEALDKFQRAQAVVNAPTNLLHIAECQAAETKLVEAAETYRAVGRFNLGPNPPAPFVAAQSQAAAELAQLEPRIPELTIDVAPPNIPTVQVTIDDQPIPTALVGVSRPVNPGPHKIAAQAPGYSREEKTVDVKERSKQKMTLELKATGGVTYGPAGAAAGAAAQPGPTPPPPASSAPPPAKPPPYDAKKEPDARPRTSLMLGLRLGAAIPSGDMPLSNGTKPAFGNYGKTGVGLGLEGKLRFARVVYVGALLQANGYGDGSLKASQPDTGKAGGGIVAGTLGWISNPDGFGVVLNGGLGYRWVNVTRTADSGTGTVEDSAGGGALQLGFGLFIRAGSVFRIVPKVEVNMGSIQAEKAAANQAAAKTSFADFFIGLTGDFDIALDKGK